MSGGIGAGGSGVTRGTLPTREVLHVVAVEVVLALPAVEAPTATLRGELQVLRARPCDVERVVGPRHLLDTGYDRQPDVNVPVIEDKQADV